MQATIVGRSAGSAGGIATAAVAANSQPEHLKTRSPMQITCALIGNDDDVIEQTSLNHSVDCMCASGGSGWRLIINNHPY